MARSTYIYTVGGFHGFPLLGAFTVKHECRRFCKVLDQRGQLDYRLFPVCRVRDGYSVDKHPKTDLGTVEEFANE